MKQKYVIYLNNKRIILISNTILNEKIKKKKHVYYSEAFKTDDFLSKLSKSKSNKAYLIFENDTHPLTLFKKKGMIIKAGGGIVRNNKGSFLFIKRNNKWDLPKGKIEKNEHKKDAALREVREETGIKNLKIERFYKKTYHIFKRCNTYKLKLTYWYLMASNHKKEFVPQLDENITKVKWKKQSQLKKTLSKSYGNISLLMKHLSHKDIKYKNS